MSHSITLGTAVFMAVAAACGNTAEGVKKDADNLAAKTAEATSDVAAAVDAAVETADVKKSLIADSRIDASGIDVDTNKDTKTLTLKGTVPTEAQKTLAAEIATAHAPGYTIVNNLTIKAP
jgi:osmotically-inducible protein OsmY